MSDDRERDDDARLPPPEDWEGRQGVLGDLASRFIRAGAEAVVNTSGRIKERGEEFRPREVLVGAAKATAKGKDEIVTLVAKEVRSYLDKLELGKELAEFARTHELEVNATFKLRAKDDGDKT